MKSAGPVPSGNSIKLPDNFERRRMLYDAARTVIEAVSNTSKQQSLFSLALEHRKLLYDTIKKGTFPLLPDTRGTVDTTPAVNVINNTIYQGPDTLILKAHQAAHGFPTAEYVTVTQLEEASRRQGLHGTTVRKPHPVTLPVLDPEHPQEDGRPSVKLMCLYNVAEAAHPRAVRQLALTKSLNETRARERDRAVHPAAAGPVLKITSSNPEKYLGQAFAAMTLNGPCKSDSVTAARFTNQIVDYLYGKTVGKDGMKHDNPYLLYQLGTQASKACKEIIPKVLHKPEPGQTQAGPGHLKYSKQKYNRAGEFSMS
jgi:hypothetical protein